MMVGRGTWGRAALVSALLVLCPLTGSGESRGQEPVAPFALIGEARAALARGDGIAAEMKLRAALGNGAPRGEVAAWMGEAYLAQGQLAKARSWLEEGGFAPGSAARGWRALARLEQLSGHFEAGQAAFAKARALTPDDPELWVEMGRLDYVRGAHMEAIAAADHALELGPHNARALQFKGQLVRDRYGLAGALPWFEKGIMAAPSDVSLLLDYAATLGDLGRAAQTVTVTRRVLELMPGNAQAYYLQAVIAARAGNFELARSLLTHTEGQLDMVPGVQQLRGVAELALGNPQTAIEAFEAVLRQRPDSRRTKDLLARAIYEAGQLRFATMRFGPDIARDEASPYLLTQVARAYEVLGNRQKAGELLDRAARPAQAQLRVVGRGGPIGRLLAEGQGRAAERAAEAMRQDRPGFFDSQALAGDVQLALGHPAAAQERYALATRVRMPPGLFRRRVEAFLLAGDPKGAQGLVQGYLDQSPQSRSALRAAAGLAMASGDYLRARAILTWLRDNGGTRDVRLLCDLALVETGLGHTQEAREAAQAAYRLQRSSPDAAQALGFALAVSEEAPGTARALLAKARSMVGETPLIAEGEALLDDVPNAG
ncbi:tetratricopeptide repeat protein [Novosphingobium sp. MBES04]|uniref:tetratricopeptide repeat protein n=1 Tax=Novosphingobium sp. MBES04 TaxID=1206458 RepID=UPI00057DD120|nr:tetratricopeptide repeat protein [Novosphingobium sp. MBES04]GAM06986.1 hypothetical conserved protein [Novosphingobium sp. MBES04]